MGKALAFLVDELLGIMLFILGFNPTQSFCTAFLGLLCKILRRRMPALAELVMNESSRRGFLKSGSLVLGTVGAGTVSVVRPTLANAATKGADPVAGFGWEVTNFHNNGADIYFEVVNAMTLSSINIDVAMAPNPAPTTTGLIELLCTGYVSRGGAPGTVNGGTAFVSGVNAAVSQPTSANLGPVTVFNPNNLSSTQLVVQQDLFYAVILKSWVPSGGSASATSRQVLASPSLKLNAGDYLVFRMGHAGVTACDAEMQGVLQYTLG